jgi:hypothetical protein
MYNLNRTCKVLEEYVFMVTTEYEEKLTLFWIIAVQL